MSPAEKEGETRKAFPEAFTSPPKLQPSEKKPGQLSPGQLQQFFEKGYVVLENFIETDLLDRLKLEFEAEVNELVEGLFKADKIKNKYEGEDFFHRLIRVNEEYPGASVVMHKQDQLGPVGRELWSHPKLLDTLEQILGPEVAGHPVWNLRVKLPNNEPEVVPWHQDNGYFSDDAAATMIATAWIPMLDTNMKNGGMQVVANSHKKGLLGDHHCCSGGTWYIEMDEEEIEKTLGCDMKNDTIDCPVSYGGVLLFSNVLAHRSVANVSDAIRWSVDLRWQDPRKPNGREGLETSDQMPLMRSLSRSITKIDWPKCSRKENDIASANCGHKEDKKEEDPFDTRIAGPWMRRWPIKHHNRHTRLAGITED